MLALSRKLGQKILVGDNIVIQVAKISEKRVVLAIDAPPSVRVLRAELKRARRVLCQLCGGKGSWIELQGLVKCGACGAHGWTLEVERNDPPEGNDA